MTTARLRGQRRAELAQRLAHRFRTEHVTVTALALGIERRPRTVRQLLAEGGVCSRWLLIGLPDDEVTALLARRFRRGVPVKELRLVTGIDERAIRERLRQAGVELTKWTRREDLDASELAEQYEAGASLDDLAEQTDSSFGTVRRLLLGAGVELRPRGGGSEHRRHRSGSRK